MDRVSRSTGDRPARPIQAVLFDAVGTLIHPAPGVAEAYWSVGRQFGSRLTPAEVERRFRGAYARSESADIEDAALRTSEHRERARWSSIVREVFCDVNDSAELFDAMWDHFARPEHWRLFDDVQDCWSALQRRGLTLGLASNFDHRLQRIWSALQKSDHKPRVFISSLVGYRKPHPAFFDAIERALDCQPENLLLVGDDPVNDVQGARAAGWQVVWLDRVDAGSAQKLPVPRLSSLSELVAWLDSHSGEIS